ncbi:hypothetical protein HMPREF9257_0052 [Eremococcus coleocola ACS-139-V-Col8]|uniref:Uncharacterized protein n=1 Tax=Eremococcus coleocola ACS-139-V-Col8 TaxID=908337 RepID=E4KN75_9LACT|nr:hypothetical protein HMPREF9257_0052 [Eremococcus coleocola ACS-139-V-Col8]
MQMIGKNSQESDFTDFSSIIIKKDNQLYLHNRLSLFYFTGGNLYG